MTFIEIPKLAGRATFMGLLAFGLSQSAFAAQEVGQSFTLDGRLYSNAAGTTPMEENPVELKLQILNNNQTCILYEETQNVNTSSTNGFFTIQVGSASGAGKRTAFYSARTMQSVYSNTVASITGRLVSDGSNCTYNPSSGHIRYLRVLIKPPDNVTRIISPNMPITSVPTSLVAERAESVQGYSASQLLLVNTNAPISLSQTNLEDVFSTTNFTKLQDLLDGTSTQYIPSSPGTLIDFNGQRLTDVATPTAATDAANKGYVDTRIGGAALDVTGVGLGVGGGSTLVWDQAANEWVAQAPGAGYEIVAGNGLLGGTLSAGDTISIDVGTTANKIVQLTNTGVLPALDGWLLTNLNAPVLSVAGRTGVVSLNAADITGLGTAALRNYGTAANNLVELTNDAVLPAVDGYLLTNVNATRLRSYAIAATAPADNQILTWNNTTAVWEPRSPAVAGITDLTGDVTATGPGSAVATIANSAITAAKINATGYAINRLLITDGTNPNLVTYATCTDGEILVYGPTGWLCNSMNEANAFFQGGNAFGTVATLGTTDATNLNVITNNATRMTVTSAGSVGIGTTSPNGLFAVGSGSPFTVSNTGWLTAQGVGTSGSIGSTIWDTTVYTSSGAAQYPGALYISSRNLATTNGVVSSYVASTTNSSGNSQAAFFGAISNSGASAYTPSIVIGQQTGSSSYVERMRINDAGLVGIGTTSPKSILEISATGTNSALIVPRDTTANRPAGNVADGMIRYNTDDAKFEFYQAGAWVNYASGSGAGSAFTQGGNAFGQVATLGTTDAANLNIITGGSTRMMVGSSGKVGIGTTTPEETLDVMGTIQSQRLCFEDSGCTAALYNGWGVRIDGGAGQNPAQIVNTSLLVGYLGDGSNFGSNNLLVAGKVGIGTTSPRSILELTSTGTNSALIVPRDTTANRPAGNVTNGMVRYNTDDAKFEFYQAGAWVNYGTGGGTVGSVVAGTGLSPLTITSTGTLNVDVGVTANKIVQLTADAQLPAVDGNLISNVNAVKLQTRNIAATAPSDNQVLTWNNTTSVWEPRSAQGSTTAFVQGGNAFGQVATLGTSDASNLNIITNGATRMTITSTGNVGIGTSTPGSRLLYVAGDMETEGVTYTDSLVTYGNMSAGLNIHSAGIVTADGNIGSSGQFLSYGGTVTLPGYSFTGDSDSGWWRSGADTIAASTGGAKRIEISANGNVGIGGTSAPKSILDLTSTGTNSALLVPRDTTANRPAGNVTNGMIRYNTTDAKFEFYQAGAWVNFASGSGAGSAFTQGGNAFGQVATLGTTDATNLNIITNNSSGLIITSAGDVGIGTSTPGTKLSVSKTIVDNTYNYRAPIYSNTNVNPSAPGTYNTSGIYSYIKTDGAQNLAEVSGVKAYLYHEGSGVLQKGIGGSFSADSDSPTTNLIGVQAEAGAFTGSAAVTNAIGGSFTATNPNNLVFQNLYGIKAKAVIGGSEGASSAYGSYFEVFGDASAPILNGYGSFIDVGSGSADNITNGYGVYISDVHANTSQFGIYQQGVDDRNFFAGTVGVGTTSPKSILDLTSTGTNSALLVPRDTTANRPAGNVTNGMIRYNTTDAKFEFYQAGAWVNFASGSGAGSAFTQGGNAFGQVATLGTTDATNLNIITNNLNRMTVTAGGNVGVGTVSPTASLHVVRTATESNQESINSTLTVSPSIAGQSGIATNNYISSSGTQNISSIIGIASSANHGSTGTINKVNGASFSAGANLGAGLATNVAGVFAEGGNHSSAGTITNAYGGIFYGSNYYNSTINNLFGVDAVAVSQSSSTTSAAYGVRAQVVGQGSAPIVNGYGAYLDVGSTGGTITNGHGLYISDVYGTANQYGVYQASSNDKNYFAGTVGIGTTSPKSILDLTSTGTNSALLVPRDTTANRPAGNVTNGMIRYNTDDAKFEFYQAGAWVNYASGSGAGSAFTQGGNAFGQVATLGTTDATNLNIITNNANRITVTAGGNVGIGTTSPTSMIHTNATMTVGGRHKYSNVTFTPSGAGQGVKVDENYLEITGTQNVNSMYGTQSYTGFDSSGTLGTGIGGDFQADSLGSGAITTLIGIRGNAGAQGGSATVTNSYGGYFSSINQYNSPATNLYGSYSQTGNNGSATTAQSYGSYSYVFGGGPAASITNAYGFYAKIEGSTEIVNGHGIYIEDVLASTNQYGVYQAGSNDKNYFAGTVGIGTSAPKSILDLTSTGTNSALLVPRDTTANRPAGNVTNGMIRYNTTDAKFEFYQAGAWVNFASGSGAGSAFAQGGNAFGQVATLGTTDATNLNIITNNANRMTVTAEGNVGIGTAAPEYLLDLRKSYSNALDNKAFNIRADKTSSTGSVTGMTISSESNGGTSGTIKGATISASTLNSGTVSGVVGLEVESSNYAGTVAGDLMGIQIYSSSGGTVVNGDRYALYIDQDGPVQGEDFALYQASTTARSHFAGIVGIGTTTPKSILELSATGSDSALIVPRDTTANRPAGNVTNGMIRYNTTDAKFEFYQAGAWVNYGTGGGTVGSVVAGTGLSPLTITSAGTLNVDVGVTANKIVQLTADAQLPAVDGNLISNVNAVKLQTRNIAATAPSDNQVLTWNNTTSVWEPRAAQASTTVFFQGGNAFGQVATLGTTDAMGLSLFTNNSARIVVDSAGNIGIGAASPAELLHVRSETETILRMDSYTNTAAFNPSVKFYRARGTASAPTVVQNNNTLFELEGIGYDSNSFEQAGKIELNVDGTAANGDMPGRWDFYTTPDGSATPAVRVTIKNDGNVGIGTSTPKSILELSATGTNSALLVPRDTTANRPAGNVTNGMIRYNTTDAKFEFYQAGAWVNFASASGSGSAFTQGGNAFGQVGTLGTTDATNLNIITNNANRVTVTSAGNVGVGTVTPSSLLDVAGKGRFLSSDEGAGAQTSSGASYSIPDISRNVRRITLDANTTVTLPAITSLATDQAYSLTVRVTQDATGSRTLAWAGGGNTIKWDIGAAPAPATGANEVTIYQFFIIGGETTWYASLVWREN